MHSTIFSKSPPSGKNKMPRCGGVITVFFALLSILFLGLMFTLIESARYQGARAQAANITDVAHYSAFSEFEQMLLKEFEIFGIDGSYGSGDFSISRFRDRLLSFINENASPARDGIVSLFFDPWQISVSNCRIDDYLLLTDSGGEPFYQEAVSYMRKTAVTQAASALLSFRQDALDAKEKQDQYEKEKMNADREMEELEKQEEQLESEAAPSEPDADAVIIDQEADREAGKREAEQRKKLNPIPALRRLAKKDLLTLICGDASISAARVDRSALVYARRRMQGTMRCPVQWSGILNDLYFREYLLGRFGDFRSAKERVQLQYELEYILSGKRSDRDNLKEVIKKLLLLREGCNYVYCVSDEEMNSEAGALSFLLIGWTGIPALTAILKHALLLGWAYAESLLDVRELIGGGKVPLIASPETWVLSIDQLARIDELMEAETGKSRDGLDYHGYLRLLLNLQSVAVQKKRGIELMELRIRKGEGLSGFRADHLIIAVRDRTAWNIPPLLSQAAGALIGLMSGNAAYVTEGGFSYLFPEL